MVGCRRRKSIWSLRSSACSLAYWLVRFHCKLHFPCTHFCPQFHRSKRRKIVFSLCFYRGNAIDFEGEPHSNTDRCTGTGQLVYICHTSIMLQPLHWAHHQWLFSMLQRIDLTNLICLIEAKSGKTHLPFQCLPFLYITLKMPPLSTILFSSTFFFFAWLLPKSIYYARLLWKTHLNHHK